MRQRLAGRGDETRITTACLLAAGIGSRLLPLTEAIPKCLTKIDGRPLLERLVTCLRDRGFKRLLVVSAISKSASAVSWATAPVA
ncbi:MAG: NTP transferase domain-containing protein [Myxococcales bacterium]|nr:NTP transferase domain-containing protein [Myxococcales bacterium]